MDTETDGRFARTSRTRHAILEAFVALVDRHGAQPTMDAVADEGAISVRTLYRHYPEASSVVVAALAHSLAWTAPPELVVGPSRPVNERIIAVTAAWSRVAESNLVLWALAAAIPVDDPDVVASLAESRAAGRAQLRALFARELSRREGATRSMMLDAIESAVSVASWYGLRTDQGLAATRAKRITEAIVAGALTLR